MTTMTDIFTLMNACNTLKKIPRTGWVWRGISDAESVADHSYSTSLIAMMLSDILIQDGLTVNSETVIRMALIHDLAESKIGDIPVPATTYINNAIKHNAEQLAICDITSNTVYQSLWKEYESCESTEAKLVKVSDKIDMLFQALEYEKQGRRNLDEFWQYAEQASIFDLHPIIKKIKDELISQHNLLIKGE